MKLKLFSIFALVLVFSLLLTACGAGKSIKITTQGSVNYCELHVSKTGADAYGANVLPSGQTVTPGKEFDIPVTDSGSYDVKVVACDNAGEQVVTVAVP